MDTEIDRLFKERESVLKEWYAAFNTENPEGIVCEVENIEDICHKLYLVNGEQENQRQKKCTILKKSLKLYRIGVVNFVERRKT